MSSINGIGNQSPISKVATQPVQKQVPAEAPKQMLATDKVQISGMNHMLEMLKTNEIRADKVATVKSQIEAGTYESDQKLDAAIDRLIDDLDR
jgi:anti-sigma28 factor (negative regulator of flagellin synthesis)